MYKGINNTSKSKSYTFMNILYAIGRQIIGSDIQLLFEYFL